MANSKIAPIFKTKYFYEFSIFLFLVFEFALMVNDVKSNTYINTETAYLITYELGFIPQAFVGSVISLFTNYITSRLIFIISIISFMILVSFISFLLGSIIRRSQSDVKTATIIFVMLFLTSPFSITYLLGMHTGRFDIYWILLTLLALVFYKPFLKWMIPILSLIAVLIHQGYITTYMPALAIPLLYEIHKNKYSKTSITVFSLCCFSAASLFLYFQFFPAKLPIDNVVDLAAQLSKNADFSASEIMLQVGFFAPFSEWFTQYVWPLTASYALQLSIVMITFSLPLMIIFYYIWKQSFKNTKDKLLKFIFILCAAAPLLFIPAAILVNDWDRYWAAVINNQFIILFYFIYSTETAVIDAVKRVGNFFKKHFLLLLLILIFTNSFTFSKVVTDIFSLVRNRNEVAEILDKYRKFIMR